MASPQLENGFTRIANEILDHLVCAGFSGHELEVLLFVMRKTYGFRKKADKIPITQFQNALGISDRSQMCRILKKLVARKPLGKDKNGYYFNKNWQEWLAASTPPAKIATKVVAWKSTASGVGVHLASGLEATLKRKSTKETIQKKRESTPAQIAKHFFEDQQGMKEVTDYYNARGVPEEIIKQEVQKFILYWTETNHAGTKQRWQMEKTFEIKRRLVSWMSRIRQFNKSNETKGMTL